MVMFSRGADASLDGVCHGCFSASALGIGSRKKMPARLGDEAESVLPDKLPDKVAPKPAPSSIGSALAKGSSMGSEGTAGTTSESPSDSKRIRMSKTFSEGLMLPERVDSRTRVSSDHEHNLPWYSIWTITLCIAVSVAIVNFFMVDLGTKLHHFKFHTVEDVFIQTGSPAMGGLVLGVICVAYCSVAAGLVLFCNPSVAGSGIPEMKGYMNGNHIPDLFRVSAFLVRVLGIVFSTSAGLPIGREGPMVGIGGFIGYSITHLGALPFVRQRVDAAANSTVLLIDEERYSYAKRIGCVLGAATGIAAAFNAPIGGILYLFEEVTTTNWEPELTFRAFVCTVVGTMLCKGLFNLVGGDVHQLLLYVDEADAYGQAGQWSWIDTLPIVLLAAIMGVLAGFMTKVFVFVWTFRRRTASRLAKYQPWAKLLEVLLFTFVVAFTFAMVPALVDCSVDAHASEHAAHGSNNHGAFTTISTNASHGSDHESADHHRRLSGGLVQNRYICPEGQYNDVATLILTGPEEAVKHLFARGHEPISVVHLILALGTYFVFALGVPGLAIPSGSFVPSMLIGALSGRLVGEVMQVFDAASFADPGVYSLAGSAAMLGGFTHMTIAIVALLVEAAHDLSLVPIMMMSIFISHIASKYINHHGYDEILILAKGIPYLDAEMPHGIAESGATARDLCETLPAKAHLLQYASVDELKTALEATQSELIPVMEEQSCIGLATRTRLDAVLTEVKNLEPPAKDFMRQTSAGSASGSGGLTSSVSMRSLAMAEDNFGTVKEYVVGGLRMDLGERDESVKRFVSKLMLSDGGPSNGRRIIPVHRFSDSSPYSIMEDTPLKRVYDLFSRSGLQAACVISRGGVFRGLIYRTCLIDASAYAMESEHHQRSPCRSYDQPEGGDDVGRQQSVAGIRRRSLTKGLGSNSDLGELEQQDTSQEQEMTEGTSEQKSKGRDADREVV